MTVRPAKIQISLGIRPVWSESSLSAQRVAKDPSFLHADSEDSDQTGRMPRLIWVFAGRTCHFADFVMRRLIFWKHIYHELLFGFEIGFQYIFFGMNEEHFKLKNKFSIFFFRGAGGGGGVKIAFLTKSQISGNPQNLYSIPWTYRFSEKQEFL